MNLEYNYYYFKSALSNKFCDELIKYGASKNEDIALTGNLDLETISKEQMKVLKKKRDSNVSFLTDPWIHKEILPYVHEANRDAGWNFQIDSNEPFQFTKYKLNQFYEWHQDSFTKPFENHKMQILNGKIRKLSVTCSLSDPKDYKGGELEFDFRNGEGKKISNIRKCVEILPRGSIVVFPSFVWHRVRPVTKGTRYSLVIWHSGKPFI
jgi:PKHD-type hydroxylase